LVCINVMILP